MNITIDNYEAYLLDYLEGSLNPEGAAELKIFIEAQGLDWDELTEPLPYLEASEMAYNGKQKLKRQRAVVPLYVKIASAAAAAGLLLTVTLWPEKSMPQTEPIAELKPIEVTRIDTKFEFMDLPQRTVPLVKSQAVIKEKPNVVERVEMPLLAELPSKKATPIPYDSPLTNFDEPDFGLLTWQSNNNYAFSPHANEEFSADEDDLSLIGKAIFRLTEGRHDSFASLIGAGVRKAKQDLTEAATDMALAAYQRAEDSFEETRLHWEEKRGE